MVKRLQAVEKELVSKTTKKQYLRRKIRDLSNNSSRLCQILMLYSNNNPEGLKRLSLDSLHKIEQNLQRFLGSLKDEKMLKILSSNIQKDTKSHPESSKLLFEMIKAVNGTEIADGPSISRNEPFGEKDFEDEFFIITEEYCSDKSSKKKLCQAQEDKEAVNLAALRFEPIAVSKDSENMEIESIAKNPFSVINGSQFQENSVFLTDKKTPKILLSNEQTPWIGSLKKPHNTHNKSARSQCSFGSPMRDSVLHERTNLDHSTTRNLLEELRIAEQAQETRFALDNENINILLNTTHLSGKKNEGENSRVQTAKKRETEAIELGKKAQGIAFDTEFIQNIRA